MGKDKFPVVKLGVSSENFVIGEAISSYHTVAIGSGPIGLLSALAALKNSKPDEKVAILADRRDELGIRQQVLWIEQDVFLFIQELVGVDLMEQYIMETAITGSEEDGYYITTGDLEKLLYAALSQYTRGVDYDLVDVQKITPQQNIKEAIQIDKKHQTISVQAFKINDVELGDHSPQLHTLHFKYLVAADGAKRTIAKAMGEEIVFDHTQSSLQHTKHVVATFRIPEGTTPQVCYKLKVYPGDTGPEPVSMPAVDSSFTRDITPCSLKKLKKEFGWDGYTRPFSQIYATRDVVYIGAELPRNLPKEKTREYALLMMQDQLPTDYIAKLTEIPADITTSYGRKMEQLKVSVFDIELGELNKTLDVCFNEDNGEYGIIFYMGDSKKNPLYTTGTGVQTGVREVMAFNVYLKRMDEDIPANDKRSEAEIIRERLEEYHAHTQEILERISAIQDQWIQKRIEKATEAEKNNQNFMQHKKNISALQGFIDEVRKSQIQSHDSDICSFFTGTSARLNELQGRHQKVFACCRGEDYITSYNGVNVKELINDFQKIKDETMAQCLALETRSIQFPESEQRLLTHYYSQIEKQFQAEELCLNKMGIFSETQKTVYEPQLTHNSSFDDSDSNFTISSLKGS